MGLDWVVLARIDGNQETNPTEVIGAARATRDDPKVVEALRGTFEGQGRSGSFEQFLEEVTNQEPPPIVLPFGPDAKGAMPAVRAEAQYYGYRGKALEPELNRLSAAAEKGGEDLGWMYGELTSRHEIEVRVSALTRILERHRRNHSTECSVADEFFAAWQRGDDAQLQGFEKRFAEEPEFGDHVFEVFSYLGAISWFRFWSDKGFVISPDF